MTNQPALNCAGLLGDKTCNWLKDVIVCDGKDCSFYKTEQTMREQAENAVERLESLGKEKAEYFNSKYHKGR